MREKQTIICIIENVFVYKLCGLNWRTKIDTQFGVTFYEPRDPRKTKIIRMNCSRRTASKSSQSRETAKTYFVHPENFIK